MDEIIIDGVDVSGCGFAVKPINDNRIKCHCAKGLLQIAKMQEQPESIKSGLCENNPNCYYKQLKRTQNILQEIKNLVTTDYIQIKRQLVQKYDCLDNFMQKIEDKCNEVIV